MGYAIYGIGNDRFGGYGVPAVCEHPECSKEIDRGMSYACGGEPFSEYGCDRYFCENHSEMAVYDLQGDLVTGEKYREDKEDEYEFKTVCERCAKGKDPFDFKSESAEWMKYILKDESWKKWRSENPKIVLKYNKELGTN